MGAIGGLLAQVCLGQQTYGCVLFRLCRHACSLLQHEGAQAAQSLLLLTHVHHGMRLLVECATGCNARAFSAQRLAACAMCVWQLHVLATYLGVAGVQAKVRQLLLEVTRRMIAECCTHGICSEVGTVRCDSRSSIAVDLHVHTRALKSCQAQSVQKHSACHFTLEMPLGFRGVRALRLLQPPVMQRH